SSPWRASCASCCGPPAPSFSSTSSSAARSVSWRKPRPGRSSEAMFVLAPPAIAAGYRLEAHQSVTSTNALALERAREGDPGRLWVVATEQRGGRGRRGRPWATPRGNLAATLLLVDAFDPATAATLGFVAGLALGDALAAVVPEAT